MGPGQEFHAGKIWPGDMAPIGRILGFSGTPPKNPPWPTPDRGFLISAKAVSPLPIDFMFLAWRAHLRLAGESELTQHIPQEQAHDSGIIGFTIKGCHRL
jgi:hypothetical protein